MLSSNGESQAESALSAQGINVKAATLEVYVQKLMDSFDASTGKIEQSQVSFCQVLLRMHAWFTTSIELFRILTHNALPGTSLPMEHGYSAKQSLTDSNNNCCTCSDTELRRRNNRYLSRLIFDDPDLASSELASSEHGSHSTNSTLANGETTSVVTHSTSYSLSSSPRSRKVCFVLRYWMQRFPLHFEPATELCKAVEQFKQTLEKETGLHELISGDIPSYDWMRRVTAKAAGMQRSDSQNKTSLVFQNLTSEELAKHLSYIDYKACRRITLAEYKCYARTGTMSGCTQLERSVTIFNGLTQWVQLMVLSKTHPRQRASIISKFVRVSQHLLHLKCYNTCMAVVGGISHSSIARLHKTYSYLNTDTLKLLEELTELISAKNNYQNYRKCTAQVTNDTYSLPIIGIHLKDLVTLHTGLPDTVGTEPPLINFHKMSQLSGVITGLTKLQDQVPEYNVNTDLIDTLKLALDVFYSEEEIFELSLAREPRANGGTAGNVPKDTPKSADQQNLLSEWQTGLKPPDKETINKHVSNMVTAIFKNYDLDRDGYISVEEFETISSNFPFIESSFCVLDVSDNGLLSEGEVKKYFILAKCSSLKRSFKHNFAETTYFKLTYCDHCSGLLWGLIKQGWKCKDCGINAHKSCKDRVVMDCKSKAMTNGLAKTSTSAVVSNSPSTSSLSTSPSPQTPSTPELVHNESRFTFSRLSTKSRSPGQSRAGAIFNNNCPSHSREVSACADGSLLSSASQCQPSLADNLAADPELLTMKLLEYQHLLSSKDKELEAEINEKRLLQERCINHMNEIQALKRQLSAMKQVAVAAILPPADEIGLDYSTLTD